MEVIYYEKEISIIHYGMAMSMVPVQAEKAKDEINLGVLIYGNDIFIFLLYVLQ